MQFYIPEYWNIVNYHAVFDLLLKLTDFENSMSMAAVNRRPKLSVLITLFKVALRRYDVVEKKREREKKKKKKKKKHIFGIENYLALSCDALFFLLQ